MDACSAFPSTSDFSIDEMLDDLRELVEVESPSLDVDALAASAKVLAAIIERLLGRHRVARRQPGRAARALVAAAASRRCSCSAITTRCSRSGTLAARPFDGRRRSGHRARCVRHARRDRAGPPRPGGTRRPVGRRAPVQRRRGGRFDRVACRSSRSGRLACGAVLVLEPSADGGLLKTGRKGIGTFEVTRPRPGRARRPRTGEGRERADRGRRVRCSLISEFGSPPTSAPRSRRPSRRPAPPTTSVPAEARIKVDVRVESADETRAHRVGDGRAAAGRSRGVDLGHRRRSAVRRCPSRRRPR